MRPPLRPGTWRSGLITFSGVLPVSVLLNVGLTPLLSGALPHLVLVVVNAAILVAVLNWVLLPLLHWATGGWAARTPSACTAGRTQSPSKPAAAPHVDHL